MQEAARALLPQLPPEAYLGLLTFGSAVSAYMLSQSDLVEALTLTADAIDEEGAEYLRSKVARQPSPAYATTHATRGRGGADGALPHRD